MINLIKKEFIVSLNFRSVKTILLSILIISISLIFVPFAIIAPMVLPIIISYLVITNSFYYDDLNNSEAFINSIPSKREDIVYSKYLFSLIILCISVVITYLLFGGVFFETLTVLRYRDITLVIATILLSNSIVFPVIFKYGYSKVKNFMLIIIIPIFLLINNLFIIIDDKVSHMNVYGNFPADYISNKSSFYNSIVTNININYINYSTVTLFLALIFIASLFISLKIYKKKDLL